MALTGCAYSIGPTKGIVRFQDGSCLTSGSIEFRNITDGTCFASRVNNRGVFHPTNIKSAFLWNLMKTGSQQDRV